MNRNDPFGLCKYKDIFGKIPHEPRFLNIGILDIVTTLVLVFAFSYFAKYPFWKTLVFAFFLMLFVHRLFCVKSVSDRFFFPNENNDIRFPLYVLVFVVVCFLFIRDISQNQTKRYM